MTDEIPPRRRRKLSSGCLFLLGLLAAVLVLFGLCARWYDGRFKITGADFSPLFREKPDLSPGLISATSRSGTFLDDRFMHHRAEGHATWVWKSIEIAAPDDAAIAQALSGDIAKRPGMFLIASPPGASGTIQYGASKGVRGTIAWKVEKDGGNWVVIAELREEIHRDWLSPLGGGSF